MVNIAIHNCDAKGSRASVETAQNVVWFSIKTPSGVEVSIYGREEQADALRAMADLFNEAFSKPEKPALQPVLDPDYVDDLPF